jgi:hypothetical protein
MKTRPQEQPIKSFEDLRGLRAVGYIRDSTLDQREGYGPDIQKHNEERFADSYGLVLNDRWYTEFVSGRSVQKRQEFQQLLQDAKLDLFDVLLVDHTSRFYQGVVVYHRGKPDKEIIFGAHEVPEEIKELWEQCQVVRSDRNAPRRSSPPSREQRVYPLTGVMICDGCGQPFHGIGSHQSGKISLRMTHSWHRCDMRPRSVPAVEVEQEFAELVLGCITLAEGWRSAVLSTMTKEGPEPDHSLEIQRIDAALANLRKQHLWGALDDQEFKSEHQALQRQRRSMEPSPSVQSTPNLDRAAELLQNLPALWEHPGVTQEQRRELAREVFDEIRLRDGKLFAVKPRPEYAPLFAYSLWIENQHVGGKRSS